MKKILLSLLFLSFITYADAQNIQILNGVGYPSKNYVNFVTLEVLKPLEHSTIYYFTDFKIDKNGYNEAYTELSYYKNIGKILSLTGQYNAGLNRDFQIKPVYLAGISKTHIFKNDFMLSLDVLYRYEPFVNQVCPECKIHGFQLTASFFQDREKIQISGYCDFWNMKYFIFEPQGWYKITDKFYAGIEWRTSNYDLLEDYQNYVMLGIKLNLE